MKRLIYIITLAVLLAALPLNVLAAETGTSAVTASDEKVAPGETVTFILALSGSPAVYAVMVTPQYDETLFTLVEGKWLTKGLLSDFSLETGDGVITWNEATNINLPLFSFTLRVNDTAPESSIANVGCAITVMDATDTRIEYPNAQTATVTLTTEDDGSGDPGTGEAPDPDPGTGEDPDPDPDPGTGEDPDPNPDPGTGEDPDPDPNPDPNPNPDPDPDPDPTPVGLRGDVNKNNELDARDYVLLKRAYFGTAALDETARLLADVNNNAQLDARDYVMLKRAYFKTYAIPDNLKYVY